MECVKKAISNDRDSIYAYELAEAVECLMYKNQSYKMFFKGVIIYER